MTSLRSAAAVVRSLRAWFRRHRRDLPWRENRDPYRVWVSEIMLQQTQVERVKEFFTRFMARFPTVAALAAAREPEVLRLWEGLGYYRRARQLHEAARRIAGEHAGRLPESAAALQGLPPSVQQQLLSMDLVGAALDYQALPPPWVVTYFR